MEIVFFNNRSEKFFRSVDDSLRPHLNEAFLLLGEYNYNLGMPFSKSLGGRLFELRVVDVIHLRFVYTFYRGKIWILHGFTKKTERISRRDIDYAKKQLKILLR